VEAGAHIQASPGEPTPRGEASGLVRARLISRLLDPDAYLVGRVVAPAGSGKSRLLAHVAVSYKGPVAWCGAPDPVPRSEQGLVEWLWDGIGPALGWTGVSPQHIQGMVDTLAVPGPPVLVMADDVHLVEGSDAEWALADLIGRLPGRVRLLLGSRVSLALDLSRLRVSGQLVEIGPDDLRFRAWEVEELFRDVYREPLIPEEVATLARRTGGWAAYLQLFHLATARKPLAERRRVLASLDNRSRLVQEYLTRNVFSGLPADVQDFLIRTSVLRRPTVPLCDELLGWEHGSRELLAELERRQLFTERIDDDSYRYHTVLLSYLEARLVDAIGGAGAREEHRRAALLLERERLTEDAAAAFAKAEDWDGVARTLGHPAGSGSALGGAWLEALPPTVVETDSLLLMARAGRALASGALADAVATIRAAEAVAASSVVAARCRRERDRIAAWMNPDRAVGTDWLAVLRGGTQRQPRDAQRVATTLPGPTGRFAEGAAAFLVGDMLTAVRVLRGVSTHPAAEPAMAAGAHLMACIAGEMVGREPEADELDRVRDEVEEAGIPWLDRVARAALVLSSPQSADALDNVSDACQREGDRWGEALVALMSGTGHLCSGRVGVPHFERAAMIFEELGAGVLETLSHSYLAVSAYAAGDSDRAARSAQHARTLASLLEVPGAAGLAALALGQVFGDERELSRARELLGPLGTWDWYQRLVVVRRPEAGKPGDSGESGESRDDEHLARSGSDRSVFGAEEARRGDQLRGRVSGGDRGRGVGGADGQGGDEPSELAESRRDSGQGAGSAGGARVAGIPRNGQAATHLPGPTPVQLRCLGGFSLGVGGQSVDESAAKPMERALLHLLSMRAGEPVHREALIEALWPEADPDAGLHRLQVAISALRRLIAPDQGGQPLLLARQGDSYRLMVPEDSDVDVWQVDSHLRRADLARNTGQLGAEAESLAAALSAYGGPLLPGDGPADWVVARREALQAAAVDAAARLASLRLQTGEPQAAAETARKGLSLDRYRDDLWKLLIEAADRSGHYAEAGQARRAYAAVLDELGV
jgi:DNA-binding SARP family transcriptional activator